MVSETQLLDQIQNRPPSPEELRQRYIEKQAQRIRREIAALRQSGKDVNTPAGEVDLMFQGSH